MIRILASLIGIVAITLSIGYLWLVDKFPHTNIEQVIWHLNNMELGQVDPYYARSAVRRLPSVVLLSLIWLLAVNGSHYIISFLKAKKELWTLLKHNLRPQPGWLPRLALALAIGLAGLSVFLLVKELKIDEYLRYNLSYKSLPSSEPSQDFIAEHYSIPSPQSVKFAEKNSLVLVLAESLEESFARSAAGKNYLPELERLRSSAFSSGQLLSVTNCIPTIAAMTSWAFGLPLKTPLNIHMNRYNSKHGFLPKALSIFDILAQNGYEMVAVWGSDSIFSGQNRLLEHGQFEVLDKNYFQEAGFKLAENQGSGWGFNDKFVLQRAAEQYERLKAAGQPFVLFVVTIDTHEPLGYCPPEKRSYYDYRDAVMEADRNIAAFAQLVMGDNSEDVILAVIGDHHFWGQREFRDDSFALDYKLFNLFAGALPSFPSQPDKQASALDVAPTLLQAAGAVWDSDQFGLGISLFSEGPTLLEKYGVEELGKILSSRSLLYESFY